MGVTRNVFKALKDSCSDMKDERRVAVDREKTMYTCKLNPCFMSSMFFQASENTTVATEFVQVSRFEIYHNNQLIKFDPWLSF